MTEDPRKRWQGGWARKTWDFAPGLGSGRFADPGENAREKQAHLAFKEFVSVFQILLDPISPLLRSLEGKKKKRNSFSLGNVEF